MHIKKRIIPLIVVVLMVASVAVPYDTSVEAATNVGLQQLLRGYNVLSGKELSNDHTENILFKTSASDALAEYYAFDQSYLTTFDTYSGRSMTEYAKAHGLDLKTEVSANVSVGKVFTASASAKFGMINKETYRNGFESYFFQFLVNHKRGKNAIKNMDSPATKKALQQQLNPEFLKALLNASDIKTEIFEKYGTHFITSYSLGGYSEFNLSTVVTNEEMSDTDIRNYGATVSASGRKGIGLKVGATASADMTTSSETFCQSGKAKTQVKCTVVGGVGGISLSDTDSSQIENTINRWLDSFIISGDNANCGMLVDSNLKLNGVWELLPDGYEDRKRELMKKYLEESLLKDKEFYNEFIYKAVIEGDTYKEIEAYTELESRPTTEAIEISSAADFMAIGNANKPLNGSYILTNDIDLLDITNTNYPLKSKTFTGKFEGGGHSIKYYYNNKSKLDIADPRFGLFYQNGGLIQNLSIKDTWVEYNNEAIADRTVLSDSFKPTYRAGLITGLNWGTIQNCHAIDSQLNIRLNAKCGGDYYTRSGDESIVYCGGIAGENSGNILRCSFVNKNVNSDQSTVQARTDTFEAKDNFSTYAIAGGIVGKHTKGSVSDCFFDGRGVYGYTMTRNFTIKGLLEDNHKPTLRRYIGGIAGEVVTKEADEPPTIIRCFSNGWEGDNYSATHLTGESAKKAISIANRGSVIGAGSTERYMTDCFYPETKSAVGYGNSNGATPLENFKVQEIYNVLSPHGWTLNTSLDVCPQLDKTSESAAFYIYFKDNVKPKFNECDILEDLKNIMKVNFSGVRDITDEVEIRYNFNTTGKQQIQLIYKEDGTTYYGWMGVTVNALDIGIGSPIVEDIVVSPNKVTVAAGKTQQFLSLVNGSNYPSQSVTWSVTGNKSASTKISTSGLLTVGADEGASTLNITATSNANVSKKATAIVTVTPTPIGTNNKLKSLKASKGKFTKKFKATRTKYTLKLKKSQSKTKIYAKKAQSTAKTYIKIGKGKYKSRSSITVKLNKGKSKTVYIKVKAQNGKTRTYKVIVKRAK